MLNAFSYTQRDVDRFFRSRGGHRLGIQGAEAQSLAFYVLTSPCLDISGHYRLPLKAMTRDTGFERKVLKGLFSTLRAVHFCTYDWRKQRVEVPWVTDLFTRLFQGSPDRDKALPDESRQSRHSTI